MMNQSHNSCRILITGPAPEFHGGVARYINLLIETINPAQVDFCRLVIGKRVLTSPGWNRPFEYFLEIIQFISTIIWKKPDLVHLNPSLSYSSLPLNLILLLISKLLGKPVLIMFHGWEDGIANAMVLNSPFGWLLKKLLLRADHYLVLAEKFKKQLICAGVPEKTISITSMMIETSHFGWFLDAKKLQPGDALLILFLSRLEREKGIWVLIDTIEYWRDNHPDLPLHLTIAGDGSQKIELENYVNKKRLHPLIQFAGYVRGHEKMELLQNSHVFVFPSSHNEGFPNAILEALAVGLPVIYTPIGACAEILDDENGIRIGLNNLSGEVLAKAILDLYRDENRRLTLAANNRNLVLLRFGAKSVSDQIAILYQKLIKHK